MNLLEKLQFIQSNLKAPKNQFNLFGKYHYRSCEDIQEGVKPLLKETKTILTIMDEIVQVGERYYIKATARLLDCESESVVENVAYAREEESKKGMDASQVTGAASSYARKYALNGLFCIDDTKDSDAGDNSKSSEKPKADASDNKKTETVLGTGVSDETITQKDANVLTKMVERKGLEISKVFTVPVNELTRAQYVQAVNQLQKLKDKEGAN